MSEQTRINLAGKDWFTVLEAAHYCGVSESQFRKNAHLYGLVARGFMGKQLYEKTALYMAIYEAPLWGTGGRGSSVLTTRGEEARRVVYADSPASDEAVRRLREYEERWKKNGARRARKKGS